MSADGAASAFTPPSDASSNRLRTPAAVQRFLNDLPYNDEPRGATLRTFRGVVGAARRIASRRPLSAAVILEQHGYPPLVLGFESIDHLDHVLFVYRTSTGWGSIARSRDPGCTAASRSFTTRESCPQLCRSLRRFHRPDHGRRSCGICSGDYDWRLSDGTSGRWSGFCSTGPHQSDPDVEPPLGDRVAFQKDTPDASPMYYPKDRAWSDQLRLP